MSGVLVVECSEGWKAEGQDGCWPSILEVLSGDKGGMYRNLTHIMPLMMIIKVSEGTPVAKHRGRVIY